MKTGHTPGNWTVKPRGAGTKELLVISGGITVGSAWTDDEKCVAGNARLIAAAPDLLAACIATVQSRVGTIKAAQTWAADCRDDPKIDRPLLALVDAITKAEGQ